MSISGPADRLAREPDPGAGRAPSVPWPVAQLPCKLQTESSYKYEAFALTALHFSSLTLVHHKGNSCSSLQFSAHFTSSQPKSSSGVYSRDLSMAGKLGQLMTRLHLARSRPSPAVADVPRGHMAVYVGERLKRFVIPTACLNHPTFVTLLKRVEDEFGFDHRCGGLTIPCASEGDFADIVGGMDMHHRHQ
ncbi:hypothetical protein EJB05_10075, partial [Eragrostis curvula]